MAWRTSLINEGKAAEIDTITVMDGYVAAFTKVRKGSRLVQTEECTSLCTNALHAQFLLACIHLLACSELWTSAVTSLKMPLARPSPCRLSFSALLRCRQTHMYMHDTHRHPLLSYTYIYLYYRIARNLQVNVHQDMHACI